MNRVELDYLIKGMKYWFWINGSIFNASFSINICVSVTVLNVKHIAIQVSSKCPWKYNKVGNGLRTGTEMALVFTLKPHLSILEWTCICLLLFFQASYYVPKSNTEYTALWGSVFVLSQWLLDQMHMVYTSKDDFLAARALNSIWDQKIKHCSFWAHMKCSQHKARHIKSTGCCIFSWSWFHGLVFN